MRRREGTDRRRPDLARNADAASSAGGARESAAAPAGLVEPVIPLTAAIVNEWLATLTPLDTVVLMPEVPELTREPTLARAALDRDSAAGGHAGWSVGVVASTQLCLDACTGDWSWTGWIWAGIGRKFGRRWVGGYGFAEGDFMHGRLVTLPWTCGKCSDECSSQGHVGGGAAVFPWSNLNVKLGALEIGFLFTPRGHCNGTVEFIVLGDVLQAISMTPWGKPVMVFLNRVKRAFPNLEIKAGAAGSGTLEVCRDRGGGWVVPSGKVCIGPFIEGGYDLPKTRAAATG